MVKKVAILANGGDAPGFNAVIRAIIKTAEKNNVECYGFIDGYHGLVKNEFVKLSTGNNNIGKKVQDRFKLEFIYIIDESKVEESKRVLGLNCPNCGAPIISLGEKVCNYCGTGIKDLVKKTWNLNNINND